MRTLIIDISNLQTGQESVLLLLRTWNLESTARMRISVLPLTSLIVSVMTLGHTFILCPVLVSSEKCG